MAKDPAFLLYHQDFFTGVSDMTNEEVGAYIRCLCIQASKNGITEKHMKNICFSQDVHETVKSKFKFNSETQLFENTRLKEEIEKRKKYSESRSNNRKKKEYEPLKEQNTSKTYVQHMENEDENEIEDKKEEENEIKKTEKSKKIICDVLVFPFESEVFKVQWQLWKSYKSKEHNFKFKSPISEQANLKKLSEMAQNDENKAIKIIHQSIENGWKGFFELNNKSNGPDKSNQQLFTDAMESEVAKNFRFK